MKQTGSYLFDPKVSSNFKVYFGENLKIAPEQVHLGNAYPNPTNGEILIKLDDTIYRTMKLFDNNGRLIHQWKIFPGESTISKDLSFLKNGIYLLKLEGIDKQQTVRIVKL